MGKELRIIISVIALNVFILLLGVFIAIFETVCHFRPASQSSLYNGAHGASRSTMQVFLTLLLGIMSVVIGASGLASIRLKSLPLVTISLGFLTLEFILRIATWVIVFFACVKAYETTGQVIKASFYVYGNESDAEAWAFTSAVDKFGDQEDCCGWGVEDENLYLATVWFKLANANSKLNSTVTLPESCCADPDPKSIVNCRTATSLLAAREGGIVHGLNCLDAFVASLRRTMYILLCSHACMILLDILNAYTSMTITKSLVTGAVVSDSPDSETDSLTGKTPDGQQQQQQQKKKKENER